MQKFSIEQAAARDCSDCARLLVDHLAEHKTAASAERLAKVLQDVVADTARGFLLLARENSKPVAVAYVAMILSAEHCGLVRWLEELYVEPNHRGRGIGAALLDAVLARARAAGLAAMDLEVDAEHRRAESLYRRFGFSSLERSRWVRKLNG